MPLRLKQNELNYQNTLSSPLGRITMVGFGVRQAMSLRAPRVLGQFALVYILDGQGRYEDANGRRKNIGPGDLMILFPDLAHRYNPRPGTHWVTTYLCFQGPVFDLWRTQGLLDPAKPVYHAEPIANWNRRLEEVCDAVLPVGSVPPLLAIGLLQQLLAEIVTGAGQSSVYRAGLNWVTRATGLIEAALTGPADWDRLAGQMGLSPESFRKRFTQLVGQPPARYRVGRLIDRACDWMENRNLKDHEIAEALGFCDEFYFSRRFKAVTGQSPREFRRSSLVKRKAKAA